MNYQKRQILQQISNAGNLSKSIKIQNIENLLGTKHIICDERSNCFAFALNFHKSENYYAIANEYRWKTGDSHSYHASPAFATFLLKMGILINIQQLCKNALIIYFDDKNYPTHAGIVVETSNILKEQIVESKWGTIALFKHKTWDVPVSYGNIAKYYIAPNLETLENCFKKFCCEVYDSKNKLPVFN